MNKDAYDLIIKSKNIALLTHENPDGDAIGSVMAFYNWLITLEKNVDVILDKLPKEFNFIANMNKIITDTEKKYDLAIVLDCSSQDRICQISNVFSNCQHSLNIDHHINNTKYGDINIIDGYCSSCGQIIYYLFKEWNVQISKEIGTSILSGVITDTGGFKTDTVDKYTFLLVADLLDIGINFHKIYYNLLFKKTPPRQALLKLAIDRIELFENGKIAFSYITADDMKTTGASYGDHEGLVDIGANMSGVEVSIFVREDDSYRVSLRSSGKINVRTIAEAFDGGGHSMAAGCKIDLPFEETKSALIDETKKVINEQ